MTLRPVDDSLVADICRSIAIDGYGFLYVDDVHDRIKTQYENADTSLINAGSISRSEIKETLRSLASEDLSEIEQIRTGVYYVDPFGAADGEQVTGELESLFGQRLVVTSETLRSRFSLAIDDVDFFTGELESRELVQRITAGDRDYYTIGSRLKERTGEANVDSQLRRRAQNGTLTHDKLESVIDVAATTDVIRYLEREGIVIDLDGEYLVQSAISDYGSYLANNVGDVVAEEFESAQYVLEVTEYQAVVENAVSDRFDVLSHVGRSVGDDVLEQTREALAESLGLETNDGVVVSKSEFEEYVDSEVARIKEAVEMDSDPLPATPSEYETAAEAHIEELRPANSEASNRYVRNTIESAYADRVEADFEVES